MTLQNKEFILSMDENGTPVSLILKDDPYKMNWILDNQYLKETGYHDEDKRFGQFSITLDGDAVTTGTVAKPTVTVQNGTVQVSYLLEKTEVAFVYDLASESDAFTWSIRLRNRTGKAISVSEFGIWIPFAYVMFRDKNVLRNIHNSAAVFPSISRNYTKLAMVRRDGEAKNLGMYQTKGETCSVGTYCDYENLFFENVSPSLDGMLFHKLFLAGGYPDGFENYDWIYEKGGFLLEANEEKEWSYVICTNQGEEEFYKQGLTLGHPKITYTPLNIIGEAVRGTIELSEGKELFQIRAEYQTGHVKNAIPITFEEDTNPGTFRFTFKPEAMGEHKIVFTFSDGTEDFVVLNVMDQLETVINERVEYICDSLYTGENGSPAYAFTPVSNQGESLGKANLVLKKNLLGALDVEQVRKVERCAVHYVRPKWFEDGNFRQPRKLYGDFYRCMDFEYIGHMFYLLSEFDDSVLELNDSDTYLAWAAEVFDLRVNPDLHADERGKEESQMLGVYFLYFNDLLAKLKEKGLTRIYEEIKALWEKVIDRVDAEAPTYKAAITEHFYDNAGFGPTAGALSECGKTENASRYGKLLLANIGYSNDFRAQNPDRWWEALTYMIHSLWGGVTAAAAYKVFWLLKDTAYLEESYRATAAVLYCYDTHATACAPLEKGMAASTYAVAGPHLNRPDLSRERFGQSTFYRDGGIFKKLFDNDSQTPDWDMGEELVAYLENFGDKTFIIQKDDGISVINGSFEDHGTEYEITSFAPFIRQFYYVSGHDIILLDRKDDTNKITMKKRSA